jgi:hypothetical protein
MGPSGAAGGAERSDTNVLFTPTSYENALQIDASLTMQRTKVMSPGLFYMI